MHDTADRSRRAFAFGDSSENCPRSHPDRALFLAGAVLVLLLFGAPLFFDLGGADLENDEAIYSHAVLSVSQQGAWLSPWSSPGTGPFLEKPPLKIWLVALGQLAGLPADELGLRFFDPLLGALALLYLYALGYRAGEAAGRLPGLLSGVAAALALFLFAPLIFEHGLRSNNMESALLLAYCGGAWHLLAWQRSAPGSPQSRRQLIAAALFFTFGFLVKFVAALFLPLAAAAALLPFRESWRRLWRERGLLLAAALGLFLLLAAPWFVYQHFANGALFWRVIFGQHVVERFTHHLDPGHLQAFSFYFAAIAAELGAAGTLPWVLLGLAAWLVATWRERSFFGLFVLLWAFLPLVAISFGTSKLIHYAYPFLPPFALFAGYAAAQLAAAFLRRLGAGAGPRARTSDRALAAALLVVAILLEIPPAKAYGALLARLGAGGDRTLQELAICLGRGQARTLVDEGESRPLVFVHAFRTDGIFHPLAFYSRRGAELQQLDKPDDRLLFFRLYLPPHQAATVVPEALWASFKKNLEDPGFRDSLLAQARDLGGEEETARRLADPAGLPEPPGFALAGARVFLPGPYAACLPP